MKQGNSEINIKSEENNMFCGNTYVYCSFKIFFELFYKMILQYTYKNFMPSGFWSRESLISINVKN